MTMAVKPGAIASHALTFRNASAAVAVTGNTSLGEILAGNAIDYLGVHVSNAAGGGALDVFDVQFKYHPSAEYVTVATLATDYTNAVHPVTRASASPIALAAGASVFLVLDCRGVYAVKFLASADTDPATVTVEGGGR